MWSFAFPELKKEFVQWPIHPKCSLPKMEFTEETKSESHGTNQLWADLVFFSAGLMSIWQISVHTAFPANGQWKKFHGPPTSRLNCSFKCCKKNCPLLDRAKPLPGFDTQWLGHLFWVLTMILPLTVTLRKVVIHKERRLCRKRSTCICESSELCLMIHFLIAFQC